MSFYNEINDRTNIRIFDFAGNNHYLSIFGLGYHEAARSLAERLLCQDNFPDYEGYPVVFLYRHSFELYLKGIIYEAKVLAALNDVKFEANIYRCHKLRPLAELCARILPLVLPKVKSLPQIVTDMRRVAAEFEEIDADSFAYRYPTNNEGKPSSNQVQDVNLRSMYATMTPLLEMMDAVTSQLDWDLNQAQKLYEVLEEAKGYISFDED